MPDVPLEELASAYGARLAVELLKADAELPGADAVQASGDPASELLLVKGEPGPAELGGGVTLSGADGDAVRKALGALGRDAQAFYAVLSRPVAGVTDERVSRRLRRIIEACDPAWVVAVDPAAATDVARATGLPETIPAGNVVRVLGRDLLALDGLEASLSDDALKRRVWAQMQALGTA